MKCNNQIFIWVYILLHIISFRKSGCYKESPEVPDTIAEVCRRKATITSCHCHPLLSQGEQNVFATSPRCRRLKLHQEQSLGAAGPWCSGEPYGATMSCLPAATPASRRVLHHPSRVRCPILDPGIPLRLFNLGHSSRSQRPGLDQVS
jgi:hypothetical protein